MAERLVDKLLVSVEDRIAGSLFRADCVAAIEVRGAQRRLVVEWVVTHPCEPAKIEFLKARKVPTVEIEIGLPPDSLSPAELKQWILFDAPRHWIWHPLFEWSELRRRGLVLVRRPAYPAVRFFKTRSGTKAVNEFWVKACPRFSKVVSVSVCNACPCAHYVENYQRGYVDCMGESEQRFFDDLLKMSDHELRAKLNAAIDDPYLWFERGKPNLGSGFRAGWDEPRRDLVPEVLAEMRKGPFAEPPAICGPSDRPCSNTDA